MGFKRRTKKDPNRFALYVPSEYQGTVIEAKEIMEREGESLSQKFVKFCEDYVRLHGHGNPQTLLNGFGVQTKITQRCDQPDCQELAVYESVARHGGTVYLCKSHHASAIERHLLKVSKRL